MNGCRSVKFYFFSIFSKHNSTPKPQQWFLPKVRALTSYNRIFVLINIFFAASSRDRRPSDKVAAQCKFFSKHPLKKSVIYLLQWKLNGN